MGATTDTTTPSDAHITEIAQVITYDSEEQLVFGFMSSKKTFAQIVKTQDGMIMRAIGPIEMSKPINPDDYQYMSADMKILKFKDESNNKIQGAQQIVDDSIKKFNEQFPQSTST